ncbi:MAG TPA: MASE1 domain-containing protein [Mizugakiibacter sp.]
MPSRLLFALRGLALAAAYGGGWWLLWRMSELYWFLPAGLRFGVLLLAPYRYWPFVFLGEWATFALMNAGIPWLGPLGFALDTFPHVLVCAAVVWALRGAWPRARLDTPEDVVHLLVGALLAAIAVTAANALVLQVVDIQDNTPLTYTLLTFSLGDYLGIMLLVPLMILVLRTRPAAAQLRSLARHVLILLLPAIGVLFALADTEPSLAQYARTLMLVPVVYFAFRHGVRGAALAMLAASIAVAAGAGMAQRADAPAEAQMFLAVAGTASLLLGAAIEALRASGERLALQNARLEGTNVRLDQLAQSLREVARRNLRLEEEERRGLAAELHDELGQNLTAIQTRVKLAHERLHAAGLSDVATSINDILATMRRTVRSLLNTLRPSVLDEFGLYRALAEGPVRDMLATAGINYTAQLHGDPAPIDDDTRTAIYRIVQEAATNTVRHARARSFLLRMRVGPHGGRTVVLLDLSDDGIGLPNAPPAAGRYGLQGMRDRVLALDGAIRIRTGPAGTRLRVLLRLPMREAGAAAGPAPAESSMEAA